MRIGVVIGALLMACSTGRVIAQQPAAAQGQPGLNWSDEQIRKTAHHVQAGRKLTPKTWPNGARVAVCLSVDLTIFRSPSTREIRPGRDFLRRYGALDGLPRMLKLFDRHNIPVSFYIPAVAAMMHPEMIQEINKRKHHEVAIHGWIHENPMALDDPVEEWRLISQAISLLEKQWGRRPSATGIHRGR